MTGRFAPSPTGDLHLGNLRTALVAWLAARSTNEPFLVRMEDLDRVTSSPQHEQRQLDDLAALGLTHDGEVVRQSERFALYDAALERLDDLGLTYRCWCTRREIREAASAPHAAIGRYPGTCRNLGPGEHADRAAAGRRPALRLNAAAALDHLGWSPTVEVHDAIAGTFARAVDDVVLRRNDGVPAYHVAVVVDDAAQGVTQVVRGDDLLPVTPSQVLLQRVLQLPTPEYAHVSLVVGPDGERLAKRHGAVTLRDLRRRGVTPQAVLRGLLDSLGLTCSPGDVDLWAVARGFELTSLARDRRPWVVRDL